MSFLYVTEPDCKIYFKDNQIIMDDGKGLLTKLPIEILEGVVLIGNINLTSSCQRELLKRGLPVTYLAANGQYYGRLERHGIPILSVSAVNFVWAMMKHSA